MKFFIQVLGIGCDPGRIPGIEDLVVIGDEVFSYVEYGFGEKKCLFIRRGGPLLKLALPVELPD